MDESNPIAEAVLIQDNIILAVGTEAEITALAAQDAEIIDLQGNTMLPGFIDAHSHWVNDLFEVVEIGQVQRDTKKLVEKMKDDEAAVRWWAARMLGNLTKDEEAATALTAAMQDDSAAVRVASARSLCVIGQKDKAVPVLLTEMKKDNADELEDDVCVALLRRLEKQRRESIEAFEKGGRMEQAGAERDELAVIQEFLPSLADEDTTRSWIREAIEASGAVSPRDVGRVMGTLMKAHKGEIDGGLAKRIASELLSA